MSDEEDSLRGRFVDYVAYGPPVKVARATCYLLLVVTVVALLSVFSYGVFYYTFIPQNMSKTNLHFKKSWISKEREQEGGWVKKVSTQSLHVEVPFPTDGSSFLSPGQLYSITLELNMADSEVNHHSGTFMISAHYYNQAGGLLTSSSRLVMLRYRSWLLRTLHTLAYSPLYLIGYLDESQVRSVELFNDYRENVNKPTALITIDVDNVDLQLYEASLVIRVKYSGLKYYMYYWPVTTAVCCMASIFCLVFSILFCSWLATENAPSSFSVGRPGHYQSVIKHGGEDGAAREKVGRSPARRRADGSRERQSAKRADARPGAGRDNTASEPVSCVGVTDLDDGDTPHSAATPLPTVRQRKRDAADDSASST